MLNSNQIKYELYDLHTGGTHGNRMYADYILPSYRINIEGDEYIPFIQIQNSYDKTLLFGITQGLYRQACSNGAFLGVRNVERIHLKHVGNNIDLNKEVFNVDYWLKNLDIAQTNLKRLMKEPLSNTTIDDVLKKIFNRKKDLELIKHFDLIEKNIKEFGFTRYALFNACTEFVTHALANEALYRSKNYDRAKELSVRIGNEFLPVGI